MKIGSTDEDLMHNYYCWLIIKLMSKGIVLPAAQWLIRWHHKIVASKVFNKDVLSMMHRFTIGCDDLVFLAGNYLFTVAYRLQTDWRWCVRAWNRGYSKLTNGFYNMTLKWFRMPYYNNFVSLKWAITNCWVGGFFHAFDGNYNTVEFTRVEDATAHR